MLIDAVLLTSIGVFAIRRHGPATEDWPQSDGWLITVDGRNHTPYPTASQDDNSRLRAQESMGAIYTSQSLEYLVRLLDAGSSHQAPLSILVAVQNALHWFSVEVWSQ